MSGEGNLCPGVGRCGGVFPRFGMHIGRKLVDGGVLAFGRRWSSAFLRLGIVVRVQTGKFVGMACVWRILCGWVVQSEGKLVVFVKYGISYTDEIHCSISSALKSNWNDLVCHTGCDNLFEDRGGRMDNIKMYEYLF